MKLNGSQICKMDVPIEVATRLASVGCISVMWPMCRVMVLLAFLLQCHKFFKFEHLQRECLEKLEHQPAMRQRRAYDGSEISNWGYFFRSSVGFFRLLKVLPEGVGLGVREYMSHGLRHHEPQLVIKFLPLTRHIKKKKNRSKSNLVDLISMFPSKESYEDASLFETNMVPARRCVMPLFEQNSHSTDKCIW